MTENQYHKEYREYLEFALQKYLQEKEGLSEYDARTQVMQDFENVEKRARLAGSVSYTHLTLPTTVSV